MRAVDSINSATRAVSSHSKRLQGQNRGYGATACEGLQIGHRQQEQTPPPLQSEIFANTTSFDALNRPSELSVQGSRTGNTYNSLSLISSVETLSPRSGPPPPSWELVITSTVYDAMGRKTCSSYGNNTVTEYIYDALSNRVVRVFTRTTSRSTTRQDLQYAAYDPQGNIAHIHNWRSCMALARLQAMTTCMARSTGSSNHPAGGIWHMREPGERTEMLF